MTKTVQLCSWLSAQWFCSERAFLGGGGRSVCWVRCITGQCLQFCKCLGHCQREMAPSQKQHLEWKVCPNCAHVWKIFLAVSSDHIWIPLQERSWESYFFFYLPGSMLNFNGTMPNECNKVCSLRWTLKVYMHSKEKGNFLKSLTRLTTSSFLLWTIKLRKHFCFRL